MAKLINGEIVHINEEIVRDIEKLASFWTNIRTYSSDENDEFVKAAERVETYLATYQDDHE